MAKPTIHIIALGGTIAMVPDQGGGARPALSVADLVRAAPAIDDLADIEIYDFRGTASANLTFPDLVELAKKINRLFADGVDGIVVTQGTDTLEETSFALDLMTIGGTVIFTGAMRNPGLEGSDGPANLIDAVRVSAALDRSRAGVLVVMNGEIHAASEVRKVHTSSLKAFLSSERGSLGWVEPDCIAWARQQPGSLTFAPEEVKRSARVAYYAAVLADGTAALQAIADDRYDGLVVAAFGGGHMPEETVGLLGQLAGRMPVILASRTGAGRVLEDVYAFKGAEIDLISRGLIPAGALDARKSRIFLILALSAGWPSDDIRAAFAKF